ncbi:MAG: choice-of-anchor D domain-containing protein, partial [Blastocatellia bacterium]
PGGSVTFTVRFTPTTSTPQKATIRVSSNDPNAPFYDLMAMGTSGSAVIATAIADTGNFGDVCVGKFADLPLTIDNRGNCDLRITAIASSSPEFQIPGVLIFPLVVRPGDSIQVPLRFRPTSFGAKSATFKITSNDPANMFMHTVSVSGNAPTATIVVPALIEFDNTCPGNTNNKTLTIGNSGGCDLIVTGITSSSLEFKVVGIVPFPLVIPPGSTRDVTIQFMPMGFNINPVHMAKLTIFSNDLNNPMVMVTVKGTVPPPIIQLMPDPLDFGKVCLGTFKDLPLTIKNTGDCNLTVSNITSNSPEFTLPGLPPLPIVIPPGGMRDVIVRFIPTSTGVKSAKITITSDDPATPMKMVTVKGIAPVSDIGVSGPTDFGTVMVGKSRQQVLNIFNTEPCDLLITLVCEVNSSGIIIPSTEFNLFNVLAYPVLIPGGGTLPVTIRFSPSRVGPRTANLIVCGYDPKTPGVGPPPGACPMFSNILRVVPLTGKGR